MLTVLAVHVALAFAEPAAIADTVLRESISEAAVIWAPYGLVVNRADACEHADPDTQLLAVDVDGANAPGRMGVVLGAVVFGPDGVPEPRITLFMTEVRRLVGNARVLGASEAEWPVALRDHVIARALGRVLAHEVGHYILQQRHHGSSGLMRPLQRADDLVSPSRSLFRLTEAEADRMAALIPGSKVAEKKKGPTHTVGPGGEAQPKPRHKMGRSIVRVRS